ncbi:capsid assembly scaffolding protein Gp46 family protein [Bacillus altitudinis]|uniref:capsid assembly scaffolding protein Gp46 family protein n=1 Tax=Bacillus altitudinis TaxID=293387 RepID=UPI0037C8F893
MNLEEVKQFLEQQKETPEVKSYLNELSALSEDKVRQFLDTEGGKKVLQPRLDQHFTKSLETWKTNHLDGLVDKKVKELNPTKNPLEVQVERLEKTLKMKEIKEKALEKAHQDGLPIQLIDFFLDEDSEKTETNLDTFKSVFDQHLQSKTKERLKEDGIDPKGSLQQPKIFTREQLQGLTQEQYKANEEAIDKLLSLD